MSGLIDLITGGGIGAVVGAVQRVVEKYQDNQFKKIEFDHVEKMQNLQFEHETMKQRAALLVEEVRTAGEAVVATYEHDGKFKPSQWVDNIRALVRPVLTFVLVGMAYQHPDEFLALASAVVTWWFASRVSIPRNI